MTESGEWSIAVVRVRPNAPDENLDLADMGVEAVEALEALAGGPTFSYGEDRYSFRFTITAPDFVSAIEEGRDLVLKASEQAGLPSWSVAHVEATEWTEFERQLIEPTHPDLIGVAELADMLDVSKQRASELARQSTFPQPIAQLASGPVWLEPTVQRFVSEWERRPGRPRVSRQDAAALDSISQAARNWDKDVQVRDDLGFPG